GRKGDRRISVPGTLRGTPEQAQARVQHRLAAADRLLATQRRALQRLTERHRLAEALGSLQRVRWLADHLHGIAASEYMARIHGWTSDPDGEVLRKALDEAGIPCALGFPPPPAEREAPSLTINPPWARPFEIFARLVGTPGQNEADPSIMLAVIAPLLFGYMFGDVGQGAVLLVAGLWLRKRFPATALLIWGGAWAMVFGVLFGSVFGREDLIPALWLHPVVEPLPVLTVPLLFGAGLIVLSIVLSGLEHQWAGRFFEWVCGEAGMGVALLFGIASLRHPDLMGVAVGALVLQFFGLAWNFRRSGGMAFARAAADLIEGLMRLVVNTLSFVRVGAFALAHAGLSLAVVSLADGTGNIVVSLIVMVLGNALIIAIEGLVASIQTTRLVLFEFFNRFLTAEGREFQPLAPPA
ncbi:MAG: ATPase, partial [Wenzhouxiangellaceae bacterium]|nr:ATPase [Wenzhouxiangellaceae bacterium]